MSSGHEVLESFDFSKRVVGKNRDDWSEFADGQIHAIGCKGHEDPVVTVSPYAAKRAVEKWAEKNERKVATAVDRKKNMLVFQFEVNGKPEDAKAEAPKEKAEDAPQISGKEGAKPRTRRGAKK
jgi:hypothetical protein